MLVGSLALLLCRRSILATLGVPSFCSVLVPYANVFSSDWSRLRQTRSSGPRPAELALKCAAE